MIKQEINTESLDEAIPEEQARVREILAVYKSTGAAGAMAATTVEKSLRRCDEAVASGNVIKMIESYRDLKSYSL